MQKPFYYKLFKRLGLFPNASFSDSDQTIDFGSGGISSINTKTGDITLVGDSAHGVEIYESGNQINFKSAASFFNITGTAVLSGGSFYSPVSNQSAGVTNDPSASGTRNLAKIYTPPVQAGLYKYKIMLDVAPGVGETVTLDFYLNGIFIATVYQFTGTENNIDCFYDYNMNAGDLLAFRITKSAGAATFLVFWSVGLYYYYPLYP